MRRFKVRVVDLFCGAGGFSEGFHRAGFEIVRAYDIWGPAILTHNMNHSNGRDVALKGDIYEISQFRTEDFEEAIPDSEVIIGSPPCIAFSNSNKSGKADKEVGIELIKAFLRIVARKKFKKDSKLKYWVMENVGNSEKYVQASYTMEELGLAGLTNEVLEVKGESSKLYNMKYFGVPTNRIRYICGDFPKVEELIKEDKVITLGRVLSELKEPLPNEFGNLNDLIIDPTYGIKVSRKNLTDHHYISEIPEFEWRKAKRHKTDKGYMGQMSFPENKNKPARTIMATLSRSARESMIFPIENAVDRYRVPTIREVATLMSFPIDFRFYGENESVKYRMVGNAVTPKFSYELAKAIYKDYKMTPLKNMKLLDDKFSTLKRFSDEPSFINLNGNTLVLKEEKTKKVNAKYKYHVPYLIEKTFRVELINVFDESTMSVKWEVSIHRSQGKNAEVFSNIKVPQEVFERNELRDFNAFSEEMISLIKSSEELQNNYCKTVKERSGLIGPDEMLQKIKILVDAYEGESISIDGISRLVPFKIIIAYYVLENILRGINIYEKESIRAEFAY